MNVVEEEERVVKKVVLNREETLHQCRGYWILRRGQDIVLSTIALIALAPLMAVIAVLIVLDDPHGSPIFSQSRCGRDGKLFQMFKFRTMFNDAEERMGELLSQNEMDGPAFKMKDDPRITRLGRFLRQSSLDELPQLWNIFVGDMSIVGPRPALPREVEYYDEYQLQRLYVQPGLTCYWQIQPNRNDISFDDWMELDIKYIQERSFWVDWRIIFSTIGVVLRKEGE